MNPKPFSDELETWLKSNKPKTLPGLIKVFAEKSFAIIFMMLMFIPALPIPTGGITHLFEIITMLVSLQLILGRTTVWLPKKWKNLKLGKVLEGKAIPFIIKRVRWFEKFSRPRLSPIINDRNFLRVAGLSVFLLSLGAFLAAPFSGLDTLPSLGVVILSLGLILEDMVLFLVGFGVGAIGVALVIGLNSAIFTLTKHFL